MQGFIKITADVLLEDEEFASYLDVSDIKDPQAGNSGSFVSNREIAPKIFRKYGIVLPKGGMIIPNVKPNELTHVIQKRGSIFRKKLRAE